MQVVGGRGEGTLAINGIEHTQGVESQRHVRFFE